MRLSIAMIVRNEASRLPRCLESIRGLWDELVVVDTGSTDGTDEQARRAGATVLARTWPGSFAQARNFSLEACTGDWVLILDADEAIGAEDHAVIRQALSNPSEAFYLRIRNYFRDGNQTTLDAPAQRNTASAGPGAGFAAFSDGWALRLFPRLSGLAFRGRVHEQVEPDLLARGIQPRRLEATLHHFGTTEPSSPAKQQAYFSLALADLEEDPCNSDRHLQVVIQGVIVNAWPAVKQSARWLLDRGAQPSLVRFAALRADQMLGQHEAALQHAQVLLSEQPEHALGHVHRAVSLAALGATDAARDSLRQAIGIAPHWVTAYGNLAELEGQAGKPEAARAALLEGLATNPADPMLLDWLVQLDLQFGLLEQAALDAHQALQCHPGGGGGIWHRVVALVLAKQGHLHQARTVLETGLRHHPDHPELKRFLAELPS